MGKVLTGLAPQVLHEPLDMSATSSTADLGKEVMDSSPAITNGTLSIPCPDSRDRLEDVVLIPLAGQPPKEQPLWRNCLSKDFDLRDMAALRIRYQWWQSRDTKWECGLLWCPFLHDHVRISILRSVAQLLPSGAQLPTVVFDEASSGAGRHAGPTLIELAFSDAAALDRVSHELKEINIQRPSGHYTVFKYCARTNSIPGNIMRFDCQRLPLNAINIDAFYKTLEEMASYVGELLGIGKLVAQTEEFGEVELGTVRGYIQLYRSTMLLSWDELLERMCSHVEFEGVSYLLVYAGCARQKEMRPFVRGVEDETDDEDSQGEELSATTSSTAGARPATENVNATAA